MSCDNCKKRADCKSREAFERLQSFGEAECSGYEPGKTYSSESFDDFVDQVRAKVASTFDIPIDLLYK